MSFTTTKVSTARRRIFDSVLPPPAESSSSLLPPPPPPPPPPAVPSTPSHGYNTRHHPQSSSPARDDRVSLMPNPDDVSARVAHAWVIATGFIAFADQPFPATAREWIDARGPPGAEVVAAVRYLVLSNDDGTVATREKLMEWYVCEVRRHFVGWVEPRCRIPEVRRPDRWRALWG